MQVTVNKRKMELLKKERKVGDEAPAVRLKMLSGEQKVIGMMSDKVQVMITLPYSHSLNKDIIKTIHDYRNKANVYFISSDEFFYKVNKDYASMDFENFCLKYGVYLDDTLCAKSIFVIDKEGEIVYKEVLDDLSSDFNLELFQAKLDEAVNFKRKGHVHENWMSA